MGTRHIIAVQLDGEYKIAQYGQWDGYPEGQGVDVLSFLRDSNLDVFRDRLRKLKWAASDRIEDAWVAAGAARGSDFVSIGVSNRLETAHPELSRNTGANILTFVLASPHPEELLMLNSIEFAQNSLFCEWAYVIDFDANTLEVFRGFNKEPVLEGRFVGEVETSRDGKGSVGYGPVKLLKRYSLSDLPSAEQFLADLAHDEVAA